MRHSSYAYARVAEELRALIANGTYPPGVRLPSRAALQETYAVGARPARQALLHLEQNGLAVSRGREGYFVAGEATVPTCPRPSLLHPTRRTHAARRHDPTDAPRSGEEDLTLIRLTVTTDPPPPDVALMLDTDPTTPLTTRTRVLADHHGPIAVRTSYTPTNLTHHTPLHRPEPLTQPWPEALATNTGHTPAVFTTHTSARRPTEHETTALDIPPTAIVLVHDETTASTTGLTIDLTRNVYRADTTRLADQYHRPH